MATVTFQDAPFQTVGELPAVGAPCPEFTLVKADLSDVTLAEFSGKKLILNIFPSIDTGTCAASVRRFNEEVGKLENTEVLCVSADLPFAAGRFCGAEGIESVATASTFRSTFGADFGVAFESAPLTALLSRSIVVVNEQGNVVYTEQVSETVDEPNYELAIAALV
jgi:thioredoxin-dependent peroxiredoxin